MRFTFRLEYEDLVEQFLPLLWVICKYGLLSDEPRCILSHPLALSIDRTSAVVRNNLVVVYNDLSLWLLVVDWIVLGAVIFNW